MNIFRYHRLIVVLVPTLVFAAAFALRRPAYTGPSPAFHLPGVAAPPAGDSSAGFRSLAHPFADLPPANRGSMEVNMRNYTLRTAPVATSPNAAWYSNGVNNVLCSQLLLNETWLGTGFGVKRLNLLTHQTQHYTSLDGLPYNRITALAAREGVLVCAAVRQQAVGNGAAISGRAFTAEDARLEHQALCRFDSASGKWKVLDEIHQEYAKAPTPDSMEVQAIPSQCVALNRAYACLVPGIVLPGKPIALLCRLADGSVDHLATPDFLTTPLAVTTAKMDAQFLWLGSSRGLLRCNLETRTWEILLPDAMIYSGTADRDGSLWLLAKTVGPYRPDIQQGTVHDVRWDVVHIQGGQVARSYPLKNRVEAKSSWGPAFMENITLADGKVWATAYMVGYGIHGQMAYLPATYSLDPQTGQVTTYSENNRVPDYNLVPLSVLANSHTGWGVLTPLRIPERFPGWLCEAGAGEAEMLTIPNPAYDTATGERREWNVVGMGGSGRNGKFLHHLVQKQNANTFTDGEFYPLPSAQFDAQEEAFWPIALKDASNGRDKVYFLSGQSDIKLRIWDRAANTISTPPDVEAALKQYKPEWPSEFTLLPGKDCLWLGTGEAALRYDFASGRVEGARGKTDEHISYVPHHALLSIEGDTAWVKGPPNLLYTANPRMSEELTPVPLPPFPGDLESQRDKMVLFALEDHIAWFTAISFLAPNNRPVIGYNLATRTWTLPKNASLLLISAGQTQATYKEGSTRWFPACSREASAYGYDTASGQWSTLPLPPGENGVSAELVGLDARQAWFCDHTTLHRLDRQKGTWQHETLPFDFPNFPHQGVTRADNTLGFGTRVGAWLLDTVTGKWAQSPGTSIPSEALDYRVGAVDANAVWLSASRASTNLVARFDRHTHVWKHWSARDGVPPKYPSLFGDGQSCWLLAEGMLYHLNPHTDRWDNISRRLAEGRPTGDNIGIKQVLAEGKDVWLVPDTRATQLNRAPLPLPALLYRYEIATQKLTPVQPASGKTLIPNTVTATKGGLLLTAREGVYRWNRASGKWQPVTVPAVPAHFPPLVPAAAHEGAGNVWIVGEENALRFHKH